MIKNETINTRIHPHLEIDGEEDDGGKGKMGDTVDGEGEENEGGEGKG